MVAAVALAAGLGIGLVAGYVRGVDRIVMRVMDGDHGDPRHPARDRADRAFGRHAHGTVVVAIAVPEVPRVVRLVRSVVLAVREEPYVEAAVAAGARLPRLLVRHVLPNTLAPLIVQGSYVCASAMIVESILGFLGAGMPPEVPSWGNVMAEGRTFFQIAPWILFFPGAFPRGDRALGQPAGRRAPGHARPEASGGGSSEGRGEPPRFSRSAASPWNSRWTRSGKHAVEDVSFDVRGGRDRVPRGRIGVGEVGDRAGGAGSPAAGPAPGHGRRDRARGRGPERRRRRRGSARSAGAPWR